MRIETETIGAGEARRRGVYEWPVSRRTVSRYPWRYDRPVIAYIDSGSARIETDDGNIEVEAGDLVKLPSDLDCVWIVKQPVVRYYRVQPWDPAG